MKLPIDALLGNIEVLHIEEALLADGVYQRIRELLPAFRGAVETEIER